MRKTLNIKLQPSGVLRTCIFGLAVVGLLLFNGCKKTNLDYTTDYREFTDAVTASLIRLVNIGENRHIVVNGDSLTNFRYPPANPEASPEAHTQVLPTKYFPSTGQLGQTWSVPIEFITPGTPTEIRFHSGAILRQKQHTFSIDRDGRIPMDYYLLKIEEEMHDGPNVIEVPRDVTAPSRPDHFKIRLLNFVRTFDNYMVTPENLMTPMTLAYADGTPVSPETTNVPIGQWSAYVEVPYGTYQFKVLTADGRQVPMAGTSHTIQLATSAIPDIRHRDPDNNNMPASTGLVYAEMQTYQPGGVYSIAVHPYWMKYNAPGAGTAWIMTDVLQNAFQVIRDIAPPLNNSYARVQLVNATLDGTPLRLQVGPELETEAVVPTAYSRYLTAVAGTRQLLVKDASGNAVIQREVDLLAGRNYSLWVYADENQQLQSLWVSNNLAASELWGDADDRGNYGDPFRRRYTFPFAYRFLHLSADLDEITFTNQVGSPFGSTSTHLPFGIAKDDNPYHFYLGTQYADELVFMLYRSTPTESPGRWISDVTGLSTQDMIANKAMYTQANRNIPGMEPGVYTVAVIGEYQDTKKNARIMYVKHTE
ncbi:hypothetical protein SAMN05421747_1263 [Parapedobacter composti]|uniref:DUF4397 domain-containing protein n=1 Tax=Parapedobacter composti TaxID=623281 RepID=A0A1I1LYN2_9SPHI|nr:DUF4397 domain-containing protein [Parapedobacter composti]SFC78357.1 hypothetical protein SAMN05421747_1263 [Parapedobacter composti]